jgi:hypothetical protein
MPRNRLPRGKDLSARILSFLAADDERLADFMELTGVTPGNFRLVVETSGMADALVDYVLEDEFRIIAFAAYCEVSPDEVSRMPRSLRLVKS